MLEFNSNINSSFLARIGEISAVCPAEQGSHVAEGMGCPFYVKNGNNLRYKVELRNNETKIPNRQQWKGGTRKFWVFGGGNGGFER